MICPKCKTDNTEDSQFCKKCATPLPESEKAGISHTRTLETPASGLAIGSTFSERYEVLEDLGKGGMGEVYKVRDKELEETIALKILRPEIALDEKTIERFRNEIKLARKITHKNVCRMHDLGKVDNTHYITMEYVEGKDLKGFINKKERLAEKETISLAKQVCEGLVEAHELGVVHRDLKPQNIMVDDKGRAKIMDFGIARSIEAPGITMTGIIIGTPDYMSPEQADGKEAGHTSDIYSLGVILYEMVTGRLPFEGDTAISVVLKHKSQLPLDPRKFAPGISDGLSRLILICMEKDKERRYQSAEVLLSDLKNIEEGLPLGTKIRPRRATFGGSLARKKLFIPALAVVAALVAILIWQPWSTKEIISTPEDRPSLAILPFTNSTGDADLDMWGKNISSLLIHKLESSKSLYVIPKGRLLTVFERLGLQDKPEFSSEDLERMISSGVGNHFLMGEFFRSGDTFQIVFTLKDVRSDKVLISDSLEGEGRESLSVMTDELAKITKQNLKIEESDMTDEAFGQMPTTSLEAFRNYSDGAALYLQGKYKEARPLLEKAIAIDPEMAMAYHFLAVICSRIGPREKQMEYAAKASEYADRAPERQRLLIRGTQAWYYEGDLEKARIILEKLNQDYPEDLIGIRALSLVYRDVGEWDKSLEYSEKVVALFPESVQDYLNLGPRYRQMNFFEKWMALTERAIEYFPDNDTIQETRITSLIYMGEYDLALERLEEYSHIFKDWDFARRRGWIYHLKGNLDRAETEYNSLVEGNNFQSQLDGIWYLAQIRLQQGRFLEAKKLLEDRLALAVERKNLIEQLNTIVSQFYVDLRLNQPDQALRIINEGISILGPRPSWERALAFYLRGFALINQNSLTEAKATADELKQILESSEMGPQNRKFYNHLFGLIEAKKGNFEEAANYYSRFNPNRFIHPADAGPGSYYIMCLEPMAQTYYQMGDLDRALQEYEKITNLSLLRLACGDIYARSYYMLGKIYEEKGDKAKAIANYERFLELWKDADPGLPEVEDAKKRLAGL